MENTYNPLQNYLKSQGQDFSMANLQNLASSKGISGYTGTDAQNQQLAGSLSPTVVSNYNTQAKVNQIDATHQNNMNTMTPTFPTGQSQAVYAPSGDGSTGNFLGYAGNDQEKNSLLSGYNNANQTSWGSSFNAPQGAQLQPNGTYLYQGQYYSPDQLASPESIAAINNAGLQQKKYDTALQRQLDTINAQFADYKAQQQALTNSGAAQAGNAILQSTGGARGSIAQYASATADSRVNSILSDGKLAQDKLEMQRQQLLSAAQDAYDSNNKQLLDQLNSQISANRTQMLNNAKETNQKLANEKAQAKKDTDIASIYEQGITDPAQILAQLKKNGVTNVTAKDIADTIKSITPDGTDDLIKTMRLNAAPNDLIQKTIQAAATGGISSALKTAGTYGQGGGTGIIGEYNFYRAQAQAAGQTPVDFNTYQNMDANRKAKLAAASVGANGVPTKPLTETQAKDLTYAQRGTNAMQIINDLQDSIVKMNPAKYAAQKTLENTSIGNALVDEKVQQYRQAERDFVTAILRRESGASISASEFDTAERQYFPRPGDSQKTLDQKAKTRESAIASFKANVPGYDARVNAEQSSLKDMHNSLIKSGESNPLNLDIGKTNSNNNPLGI